MKASRGTFIERDLIESKAFTGLSARAITIYMLFMLRRQMSSKGRKNGKQVWVCTNNGEIEFTYLEAERKYRIGRKRFTRALDELIKRGFLDVEYAGGGYQRDKSRYSLSSRWQCFGTDRFELRERRRQSVQRGYCRPKKPCPDCPPPPTVNDAPVFSTDTSDTLNNGHIRYPKGRFSRPSTDTSDTLKRKIRIDANA